jgi:hypothetical protein
MRQMSTELSTSTQPKGLALQSVADAMKFGEMVASSDFAPKDFRGKPASCMLAIQCGAEIGLAPLQSLQSIAVVNGRPAVYGDAALAVVKASPVCEYVTESIEGDGDQMAAVCTAKRRGYPQPTVVRFTVADAKKASLWGKSGPWTQYPKRMLQMRARGFALRDAFPDVLKGLVTAEEAQDYPTPVVSETPATKPAEPVVVRPRLEPGVEPTALQKARHAIQKAKSLDDCNRLRDLIRQRHSEGVFSDSEHDDLADLLKGKAEIIIGEDAGQEFEHEAAATEATA